MLTSRTDGRAALARPTSQPFRQPNQPPTRQTATTTGTTRPRMGAIVSRAQSSRATARVLTEQGSRRRSSAPAALVLRSLAAGIDAREHLARFPTTRCTTIFFSLDPPRKLFPLMYAVSLEKLEDYVPHATLAINRSRRGPRRGVERIPRARSVVASARRWFRWRRLVSSRRRHRRSAGIGSAQQRIIRRYIHGVWRRIGYLGHQRLVPFRVSAGERRRRHLHAGAIAIGGECIRQGRGDVSPDHSIVLAERDPRREARRRHRVHDAVVPGGHHEVSEWHNAVISDVAQADAQRRQRRGVRLVDVRLFPGHVDLPWLDDAQ